MLFSVPIGGVLEMDRCCGHAEICGLSHVLQRSTLPVYAMKYLTSLDGLILVKNRGLWISQGGIEGISSLSIEEVSIRSSNARVEGTPGVAQIRYLV